ncbi:hypothetical protein HC762_01405 [bacterium]|nr:hypothetical protein [bacterium]
MALNALDEAGLKLSDVDCDFRLMRRRMFDVVRLEKNSGVICLEMMKKFKDAGFRVGEVPVHHYHRAHGKSQFFNFPRIVKTAIDVMRLWFSLVVRRQHRQPPFGKLRAALSNVEGNLARGHARPDLSQAPVVNRLAGRLDRALQREESMGKWSPKSWL